MDGLKKAALIVIPAGILVTWIAADPTAAGNTTGDVFGWVVGVFQAGGQFVTAVFS